MPAQSQSRAVQSAQVVDVQSPARLATSELEAALARQRDKLQRKLAKGKEIYTAQKAKMKEQGIDNLDFQLEQMKMAYLSKGKALIKASKAKEEEIRARFEGKGEVVDMQESAMSEDFDLDALLLEQERTHQRYLQEKQQFRQMAAAMAVVAPPSPSQQVVVPGVAFAAVTVPPQPAWLQQQPLQQEQQYQQSARQYQQSAQKPLYQQQQYHHHHHHHHHHQQQQQHEHHHQQHLPSQQQPGLHHIPVAQAKVQEPRMPQPSQ